MFEKSSLLETLDHFSKLSTAEKTWYYELNVMSHNGRKILILILCLNIFSYFVGKDIRLEHLSWFIIAMSFYPFLIIRNLLLEREKFEQEKQINTEREFIRLHSRLTFFDNY